MEGNYCLDHVIVFVDGLDSARRDYAALGFTVAGEVIEAEGGRTRHGGVAFLDGVYLELIEFKSRWVLPALRILKRIGVLGLSLSRTSPIERRVARKGVAGSGLVDFALRSENIEDDLDVARRRGLAIDGPRLLNPELPDGKELSFLLGVPEAPDLPFLVQYFTRADLIQYFTRTERPRHDQPNGVEGVSGITVVVKDLDATVGR